MRPSLILLISFILLALVSVHTFDVSSSTEAREVHVAQLMHQGNGLILPLRNGVVPSKPPLFHWFAASLGLFSDGCSVGVVRSVSVLSAVGIFLLLSVRGPLTSKRCRARGFYNWFLPLAVLASTPMFVRLLLDARVDMLFSACCLLAFFGGISKRANGPNVFYLGVSLAVLAKGPLGFLLPVLACGAYSLWLSNAVGFLKRIGKPQRAMFLLLLPLSWYISAYSIGGERFLWRVLFENLERFASGAPDRKLSAAVYLDAVFIKSAPWSYLALFLLGADLRRISKGRKRSPRQAYAFAYLVCLLFFALSEGKRDSYLLPLQPLLAMYVGDSLSSTLLAKLRLTHAVFDQCFKGILLVLLLSWIVILVFAVGVDSEHAMSAALAKYCSDNLLLLSIILLLAAMSMSAVLISEDRDLSKISLCFGILFLSFYTMGFGVKAALKNFEQIANSITSTISASGSLVVIKERHEEYFDPLEMYLSREVQIQRPGAELNCRSWYVTRRPYFEQVGQTVVEQVWYILPSDFRKSPSARDIVLFRCALLSGAEAGVAGHQETSY